MSDHYMNPEGTESLWTAIKRKLSFLAGKGLSKDGDALNVTTPVKGIVTDSEFDALPEDERNNGFYIIKDGSDGSGSGSSNLEIYSTEETRIGTWIDGKPLYRIAFSGTLPGSHGVTVSGFHISDLDRLISLSTTCLIDVWYDLPYISTSGNANLEMTIDGKLIFYGNHTTFFGKPIISVAKYTKTTD